jgi:hypothetical protein
MFSEGRIFRVVAHKKATAKELNKTIKLLYGTAWTYFKKRHKAKPHLWPKPEYFLPVLKYDNVNEYFFPQVQSTVIVETARGAGVGQSDRSDDLYLTEYAEYLNAEDVYAGLTGSMPLDNPTTRITIDFNAKGVGNDAYVKYQAAKRGELGDFAAVFYGVNDCPELYPESKLASKREELQDRYPAVYPSNDEEMWLKNELAVFSWNHVKDCKGDKYYNEMPNQGNVRYVHGVDCSEGHSDSDFQVIKGFAIEGDKFIEAYEPIRVREPEDIFARRVDEIARKYPGDVVVERNFGAAVLTVLKELNTPGLYKHEYRDKDGIQQRRLGFHTTYPSKRIMISDMQRMLRKREIILVSKNGREEMRTFEYKDDERLAGAPDSKGFYDDEVMAAMLAVQGLKAIGPPLEMY